MSQDSYTETSSRGLFTRIADSLKGIVLGLILVPVCMGVLFWNEGRAVKAYTNLSQGLQACVSAPLDKIDPENEGKLVYLTGTLQAPKPAVDPEFGIEGDFVKLTRTVEMFQWVQHESRRKEKNLGGSETTVTTYTYQQEWSSKLHNTADFKKPEGHANPPTMPWPSKTFNGPSIKFGAYTLSPALLEFIEPENKVDATPGSLSRTTVPEKAKLKILTGSYYLSKEPGPNQIGDARVSFLAASPGPVSLMAKQTGSTFQPYTTPVGGTILYLEPGTHTAQELTKHQEDAAARLTWVIRLVGFIAMGIGFNMFLRPLAILADIIPFLGDLVEAGSLFISFSLAFSVSLVIIALGWLFYRPLISIPLLIVAAVAGYIVFSKYRQARAAHQPAPIN